MGVFATFLGWVNLVQFCKMLPRLGMYVYMFNAITGTFFMVLRVFFIYIIAFGLTFYLLMKNQVRLALYVYKTTHCCHIPQERKTSIAHRKGVVERILLELQRIKSI